MLKFLLFSSLYILLFVVNTGSAQTSLEALDLYNGSAGSSEEASCITADRQGNVYSAGNSTDEITSYIYLLKYNSSGAREWVRAYRSGFNSIDKVTSISVDSAGAVYVGGYTRLAGEEFYDILVIKYSPAGDTLWSRRFNGTGNRDDRAAGIASDNGNNLYVSGSTSYSPSDGGIVSIKYNASGSMQWTSYLNTPLLDEVKSITVDNSGGFYVAGMRGVTGMVVIKYSSATGDTLWTNTFTAPQITAVSADHIITDGNLNVYAACRTLRPSVMPDYLLVKISSSGNTLWHRIYDEGPNNKDEPTDIALDNTGNVYITGNSLPLITDNSAIPPGIFSGAVTIKYDPAGAQQWVNRYFTGYQSDLKPKIAVHDPLSIYIGITEQASINDDMTVIKYNGSGDSLWASSYDNGFNLSDRSADIVCNTNGDIFLAGNSSDPQYKQDNILLKFSPSGAQETVDKYNSQGYSHDHVSSVKEDAAGNIYVTGYNEKEYFLIKYNSLLNRQWVKVFDNREIAYSSFIYHEIDTDGNILVGASCKTLSQGVNALLTKISASGTVIWEKEYNHTGTEGDMIRGMVMDNLNNTYSVVTIYTGSASTLVLLKYSSSGDIVINRSLPYTSLWVEKVYMDNNMNFYLAGSGTVNAGALLTKFNADCELVWERTYAPNGFPKTFNDVKTDKNNNVIATGYINMGGAEEENYLTIKYDSSGSQQWLKMFNGIRSYEDRAASLDIDSIGGIYITGRAYMIPATFTSSIVSIKYDNAGNQLWVKELRNSGSSKPLIKLDKYSNAYVMNNNLYYNPAAEAFKLTKYRSTGDSVWSIDYSNGYNIRNQSASFLINKDQAVIIGGRVYGQNTSYDAAVIKYSQTTGINDPSALLPGRYALHQNYPNPFNPTTNIRFDIPAGSSEDRLVTLSVYDITGRLVSILMEKELEPGSYSMPFNAYNLSSGIYFYRLKANSYMETKKMLLVK